MFYKKKLGIKSFLSVDNPLSVKIKKNIVGLFLFKGYTMMIQLLMIPLTLDILGDYKYGVWITLFNLLSMLQILDIGIGNGLKNMLTRCIVNNNFKEAKEYVSTTYIIMSAISITVLFFFIFFWDKITWHKVFNINVNHSHEVKYLIGISFLFVILSFLFGIINSILNSYHKPVYSSFIIAFSNSIIFILFLIFKEELNQKLFLIGFIYTIVPLITLIFISIWLFCGDFKKIRPSIYSFKIDKTKDLFSLGSKFFIIQISILIIFQTDTLIISHFLDPEKVTPYNIVYKYFSIITTFVVIALTPLWSGYADADERKDYVWIKNVIKKKIYGFCVVLLIILIMLLFSRKIIDFWLKKNLFLSITLLISMTIFTIINIWNNFIGVFLNGINRTKIQTITSIIGMIINIPLSIYLIKIYDIGGVLLASSISLLLFSVFGGIETYRIIKTYNCITKL